MKSDCFLGFDLGTSSVRALILSAAGQVLSAAGETYEVIIPSAGRAEQDPEIWYDCAARCARRALEKAGIDGGRIAAVSFSGQMHGLAALGADGKSCGNAIIWLDQRSAPAVKEIYSLLGRGFVASQVQNGLAAGYLLSTLFYLKTREKSRYDAISRLLLPKDYLKYRLTGEAVSDPSDAAGSLAFDNVNLRWSEELIEALGLNPALFPPILPSTAVVGRITRETAEKTGLREGTPVVNGGGDTFMQAVGNGIVDAGVFASNIGTGGQVSTTIRRPLFDPHLRSSTFAHVLPGRWHLMGACLNSGISLKWFAGTILREADYKKLDAEAAARGAGSGGLIFLPYLTGERTPHMNPNAKGLFFGLTLGTNRADMARAVMEGVAYALRDCLELLTGLGAGCEKIIASGGGARSDLWLQIQADVFGREVLRSATKEQACLGAAITAAVGVGAFESFEAACRACVPPAADVFRPLEENTAAYESGYGLFRELYQVNKPLFDADSAVSR